MGEFFKPWRPKFGVLTLMMACVFMGGWIRSTSTQDVILFSTLASTQESLYSVDGSLFWQRSKDQKPEDKLPYPVWLTHTFPIEDGVPSESKEWKWQLCGIGSGGYGSEQPEGSEATYWTVTYWSLTIPLTLISFWLLLSKPRKSTPKKITEPTPAEGN